MAANPSTALVPLQTAAIEAKHRPTLTGFEQRALAIKARPHVNGRISPITAQLSHDLNTECKLWIQAFRKETAPTKQALDAAHKAFTGFCNKMEYGAIAARDITGGIEGAYATQCRDDKRRRDLEATRIATEAAEAQKQQEIDAKLHEAETASSPEEAEERLAEAVEMEATPAIPVITAPVEDAPRIEGSNTRFELNGDIVDISAYFHWLADHPDCIEEVYPEHKKSGVKAQLRRGLRPDGIGNLREEPLTSNRSRG